MNPNTGEIRRFPNLNESKTAGFTLPVTREALMGAPGARALQKFMAQMRAEAKDRGLRRPLDLVDFEKLDGLDRRQRRDYFDERRAVERKLITNHAVRAAHKETSP